MCGFWPACWALACAIGGAGVAGCTASGDDVRAPQDRLVFPTGLAASPDERFLFVANANSELRFDSGSISVIDLGAVQGVIKQWIEHPEQFDDRGQSPRSECRRDLDHGETLVCDETEVPKGKPSLFKIGAGVRIGNFATDLAVQHFTGGLARVIVPTRGDPSITWADFLGDRLNCTRDAEPNALCDDVHRLTSVKNNPDLPLVPPEPFSVFADPINGFAMVTHLSGGAVTLIRAPSDSSQVAVVDVRLGVFPDLATGPGVASTIAGRHSETPGDALVYVGSSTEDRIQTFTVGQRDNAAAYLLQGSYFFLDSVGNNVGGSSDTRGLRFSPTGDRLYVVNRTPPSIQIYDTSLGPSGVPRNVVTGASDICQQASGIAVLDTGAGERAYVTCFQDGQVYVVDPAGQSQVEDIIPVGRGPYAAAAVDDKVDGMKDPDRRNLLFVSNFLEDTIAVIDVSPNSPQRNRVVLRIGKPRAP